MTSLFFLNSDIVKAEEYTIPTSEIELMENNSDIEIILKFLKVSGTSKITVVDSNNYIVYNEISNKILTLIKQERLHDAVALLKNHEYILSSTKEEKINTQNTIMDGISVNSIGSEVTRNFYKSHFPKDNTGTFGGSWISKMTVTYRENSNGTFTALGSPSLSVETSFGAMFNPSVSGISTSYSYTSGNRGINYSGSYSINARLVVSIDVKGVKMPYGKMYYWGRTTDTHMVR